MEIVDKIYNSIVERKKAMGTWSEGLHFQTYALASAIMRLEKLNDAIEHLPATSYESPQGMRAYPEFHLAKEAEDSITRQLKQLGLTAEDLADFKAENPMAELIDRVNDSVNR